MTSNQIHSFSPFLEFLSQIISPICHIESDQKLPEMPFTLLSNYTDVLMNVESYIRRYIQLEGLIRRQHRTWRKNTKTLSVCISWNNYTLDKIFHGRAGNRIGDTITTESRDRNILELTGLNLILNSVPF